jgi:hypothetical protein
MAGASSPSENNLGRLDLSSLRYRIDEAIMDTDDGSAEVGKLAMLGESDRSVAGILRDRAGAEERSERTTRRTSSVRRSARAPRHRERFRAAHDGHRGRANRPPDVRSTGMTATYATRHRGILDARTQSQSPLVRDGEPTCPRCHWPINSQGHVANCEA